MAHAGSFDMKLVILSVIIVIFSLFASFKIMARLAVTEGSERKPWILAGGFIMALGIWTMHFIGMLGYHVHMAVTYNLSLTFLSFVLIFLGATCVYVITAKATIPTLSQIIGASVMGVSIIGTHMIGMAAMQIKATVHFNIFLLLITLFLSLTVGVSIFLLLLYVKNNRTKITLKKLISSIFVGLGISAIHYTAMEAVQFRGGPMSFKVAHITTISNMVVSTDRLAYAIGLATIIIILSIIVLTYSDKIKAEQQRLLLEKELTQQMNKVQQDLINTIRRQQGLTLKYVKIGERYIHTLCEGELLAKLGLTPDIVVGKDLRDFLPEDYAEHKLQFYIRAWNGEIVNYEEQLNGTDYIVSLSPVVENGKVVEVIGSGVDITERKRAERISKENEMKLRESHALRRTMIDNLPIAILVLDNNLNIIALNKPHCQLFNIDAPIKSIIGQNIAKYRKLYYKSVEIEEKKADEIIKNRIPTVDEVELVDGKIIKRSYFPFYVGEEHKGHLWTFEEITERKQMEKANLKAREEAEKASLAKTRFLSNMSHELRTPLNGILGFSQLLELDGSLTHQQRMFVEEITKGGRHLLNLITEILDLSRIEEGKVNITKDTIRIASVMMECINLIGPVANQKGVQIIQEQGEGFNQCVYVDPIRLRQIILNLLDNAIKYNRESGRVVITYELNKEHLVIHIRDTGIGIPEEEQEMIFAPFYRIHHSYTEGTGIGLSLVKQLLSLMGGDVGIKSKVGEGSDIWISLPLAASIQKDQHVLHESKSNELVKNQNYTILYIEDNHSNLQLVSEILGTVSGINLLSAMTGKEGLKMAAEQQLDLILCDIHLPDLNGFEVLKRLESNALTDDIPVIAVSANAMKEEISRALDMGFADYITKPIDIASFIQVICKYLSNVDGE
ncbi:ATP-binding protein [Neobacillus drentensis]|uniref:ATP-binding protein n=1 Tax=Neobacillus drentensis TaxID=220684 RepID=UPI0030000C37